MRLLAAVRRGEVPPQVSHSWNRWVREELAAELARSVVERLGLGRAVEDRFAFTAAAEEL